MRIPERQAEINWLYETFLKEPDQDRGRGRAPQRTAAGESPYTVEEVIERVRRSPERAQIWDGDDLHYNSPSEADGRITHAVVYHAGGDPDLAAEVLRHCPRERSKWYERRKHHTWIAEEIVSAIDRCNGEFYAPRRSASGATRTGSAASGVRAAEAPKIFGRVLVGEDIEQGIAPPAELLADILLEGRVHSIYSASGMGKTFLMLWIVYKIIEQGRSVIVFDHENGRRIVAERLQELGADPKKLDKHLHYYPFPALPLDAATAEAYGALLDEVGPALVVFDSWINFLAAAGMDENVSNDIASWATAFTHPARTRGIAALLLDHVPKEGISARGSGRKKDEVDVMWKLANPEPFDRDTIGRIVLRREKDREGWLPESVGFTVGGGSSGFVFKRSDGTLEEPDTDGLKPSERRALEALIEEFGRPGARSAEWQRAADARKVARPTFYRAKDWLVARGFVGVEDRIHRATQKGYEKYHSAKKVSFGNETSTEGLGLTEVSEADSTETPIDKPITKRSQKVSQRSYFRNETSPMGRSQRSHGSISETRETSRPSAAVEALLRDPPEWLAKQLEKCRREPERFTNATASAISAEVYGTPAQWRDVRPAVVAMIGEGEA